MSSFVVHGYYYIDCITDSYPTCCLWLDNNPQAMCMHSMHDMTVATPFFVLWLHLRSSLVLFVATVSSDKIVHQCTSHLLVLTRLILVHPMTSVMAGR
jgi:hypothetical protein